MIFIEIILYYNYPIIQILAKTSNKNNSKCLIISYICKLLDLYSIKYYRSNLPHNYSTRESIFQSKKKIKFSTKFQLAHSKSKLFVQSTSKLKKNSWPFPSHKLWDFLTKNYRISVQFRHFLYFVK